MNLILVSNSLGFYDTDGKPLETPSKFVSFKFSQRFEENFMKISLCVIFVDTYVFKKALR